MSIDKERKLFEDKYPLKNGIEFNELMGWYCGGVDTTGLSIYNIRWETWQARAAQEESEQETEPTYTHEYSYYGVRKRCTLVTNVSDCYGMVVVENSIGEYVLCHESDVYPLSSAAQGTGEVLM